MNLTALVYYSYVESHIFLLGLAIVMLMFELVLRAYVSRLRQNFMKLQEGLTDETAIEELSLQYYSKKQRVTLTRTVVFAGALLVSALSYDIRAFSFLAVALGAIIIVFKETVVSMLSYFHVLRNYHIGDDVRIQEVRGEILNIRPTTTSILGKDEDGEYNGRVTALQNYHFAMHPVERQEMKSSSYLMTSLVVPFTARDYTLHFPQFIESLRAFLDDSLPFRSMKNVGFYRSYAGYRYKLNYAYADDGKIEVTISFVSKPKRIADRKERIIAFIETCKRLY